MVHNNTVHEVLIAVLQVRPTPAGVQLCVLLWQRAQPPQVGYWSLPGGRLGPDEDIETSALRQLAEKVDVREVAHLEQLAVFSDPHRTPHRRTVASTFLGIVPLFADPQLPSDTAWHPVNELPSMSFDHRTVVRRAGIRLGGKLSYTNIAFALAPAEFTLSTLRELYGAALGYPVDVTNLQRVLTRRGVLAPTGGTTASGRGGGRPAANYRFTDQSLRVTDAFAALRPPNHEATGPEHERSKCEPRASDVP